MNSEKKIGILMLIPSIILIVFFVSYPTVMTFYYSLTNYNVVKGVTDFIGLTNYISLITDSKLSNSFLRTIIFVLITVSLSMSIGIFMAVLIYECQIGKKIFTTLFSIPLAIPFVIIGVVFKFMLSYDMGIVNQILESMGIGRIPFYSSGDLALLATTIADSWWGSSFTFLVVYSGFESISRSLIEAAYIDGASTFELYKNILLPLSKRHVIVALLFRIIDAFRAFDHVYMMTAGGPGEATQYLSIYVSKVAFDYFNLGYACALAVVLLFAISILAQILFKAFIPRRTK
jgi:multiple sugar transport system permease protein